MSLALRYYCIAISFAFVLPLSAQSAELLSQPTSVLPWVAPELEPAKPLPVSVVSPKTPQEMPVWMSTSTPQANLKLLRIQKLPMVEKQQYADLGDIPAGAANPGVSAQGVLAQGVPAYNSPVTRSARAATPLSFFRTVR